MPVKDWKEYLGYGHLKDTSGMTDQQKIDAFRDYQSSCYKIYYNINPFISEEIIKNERVIKKLEQQI